MSEQSPSIMSEMPEWKEKVKPKSIIPLLSGATLESIEEMQSIQPVQTANELRRLYNTIKAHFFVLLQDEIATGNIHPDVLKFSQELRKLLEMLINFELKMTQATKTKATPKTSELLDFFRNTLDDEDRQRIASKIHEKIHIIETEEEEVEQNGT